jgi:hypothetical protein
MLFDYRIVLSGRSFLIIRLIECVSFVAILFAPCCQAGQGVEYTVLQSSWPGLGGLASPSGFGVWSLTSALGGMINLTVAMSFLASFSRRAQALKATLWVVLLIFLPLLWLCYLYAHMIPLPGHFAWIVIVLMIGFLSPLTMRDYKDRNSGSRNKRGRRSRR